MPALDACPLCRSTLAAAERLCPGCGADLTPYYDIAAMTERYMQMAQEQISRGELDQAEAIVGRLAQLGAVDDTALAGLEVRLALARQDSELARSLLPRLSASDRSWLEIQLMELTGREQAAHELYNQALSSARRGEYTRGARQMALSVQQLGNDPKLWELKLKLDLKCGNHMSVYSDLRALDSLHARPEAWQELEAVLPPI